MPSMMVATLGIALPEVRQSFSLSEIEAGSLFSVLMIVAATTSAIAGRLADKIGSKTVLISGLSFLALGFGIAGISDNRSLFFFFLGLTGLGYGFTPPSLYALMSDMLPNRRGLGASLVSVAYGIGGAIGAVLASRVTADFGWRMAFVTVGAIASVNMLMQLYWAPRVRPTRATGLAGSFGGALTIPILILALAEFIGGSVFWSSAAWVPTLLRTAKALTLQETGWVMSVLSLANMLGSIVLGSLSDKFGRRRVIFLSSLPAAAAAFIVFYSLRSPLAIALGILVFGTFKASVPALVVALAQDAAPEGSAGTASGIIMSLHYTSGVIAPLLAAELITRTGDIVLGMILASSVPLLLYGCLMIAVRERRRFRPA
ncbi:MAG TPA: MFS transporter [Candidatus Binatia bacterium]|nr:MFS transporter [Candidatus Binatia bacterium]